MMVGCERGRSFLFFTRNTHTPGLPSHAHALPLSNQYPSATLPPPVRAAVAFALSSARRASFAFANRVDRDSFSTLVLGFLMRTLAAAAAGGGVVAAAAAARRVVARAARAVLCERRGKEGESRRRGREGGGG